MLGLGWEVDRLDVSCSAFLLRGLGLGYLPKRNAWGARQPTPPPPPPRLASVCRLMTMRSCNSDVQSMGMHGHQTEPRRNARHSDSFDDTLRVDSRHIMHLRNSLRQSDFQTYLRRRAPSSHAGVWDTFTS